MKLAYVLHYVDDVEQTMHFYEKAFGLSSGFLHESKQYGEMATGATKLGFVQHGTAQSHGFTYEPMQPTKASAATEIGFVADDVSKAFEKAVKAGAQSLSQPIQKPWGQWVAYVRDCNGFLVEICSAMS